MAFIGKCLKFRNQVIARRVQCTIGQVQEKYLNSKDLLYFEGAAGPHKDHANTYLRTAERHRIGLQNLKIVVQNAQRIFPGWKSKPVRAGRVVHLVGCHVNQTQRACLVVGLFQRLV